VIAQALRRLAEDVAQAGDVQARAAAWESSPAPFASVEFQLNDGEAPPAVDVAFAEGAAPSVADLEDAFGGFVETPRLPSSGRRVLRGQVWRDGMPARVVILVYDPPAHDEPLAALHLQRGGPRPAGPTRRGSPSARA
jgi:hypothetical protein